MGLWSYHSERLGTTCYTILNVCCESEGFRSSIRSHSFKKRFIFFSGCCVKVPLMWNTLAHLDVLKTKAKLKMHKGDNVKALCVSKTLRDVLNNSLFLKALRSWHYQCETKTISDFALKPDPEMKMKLNMK